MATEDQRYPDNRSQVEGDVLLANATEVAVMLSISKREVERMAADGRLPKPIRLGKRLVRWRITTIHKWLADLEGRCQEI